MRSQRSFSGAVVSLSVALLVGAVSPALAQAQSERSRRKTPTPPLTMISVKGLGKTRAPARRSNPQPPVVPILLAEEVKTSVKAATGKDLTPDDNSAMGLTPQAPFVKDRAYLQAVGTASWNGWSILLSSKESTYGPTAFGVSFKPKAAGDPYVIDLIVAGNVAAELDCDLPDGSTRKQSIVALVSTHVVFLVTAVNTQWQQISCRPPDNVGLDLNFLGAGVTPWH
jgi:hypothetical protein